MHTLSSGAHGQRGIATVEFAICAPILFLLMFATAEIGRVLFQYNTLVKAVRDGARYAAAAATNSTRVVNITNEMRTATVNLVMTGNTAGTGGPLLEGMDPGAVIVSNNGNGFISVAATYVYEPMLGATLPTFGLGDGIDLSMTLSAAVIMR
ncbi:TadE/TadG family type IV pilus assembly protein [Peristeroidobacter agariperforans]|uniref:TadE/TadG family type IV pilus assembly protein n=1 Tax=Peristeroidobacter agariperforans TaxID=268404 RepID=UPI0013002066|nr:TadE/TadG family type IV pilus assembly protein [Peristeroidobacter agariperforans]